MSDNKLTRIVVVGGGFAGLELAKKLRGQPAEVILIDRNNYHTFQPLLYQVAAAGLEPEAIAFPIRNIVRRNKNIHFRLAQLKEVCPDKNLIKTNIGSIEYDYLVLAHGTQTNYFGMDELAGKAYPMKTVTEAFNLRNIILRNFERALLETDEKTRNALLNIVVVGAGPTGVELSGALGELKKHVLPKDYPELDFTRMNIYLLEMTDRVLSVMSEEASEKAYQFLVDIGVVVCLDTSLKSYEQDLVKTNRKDFLTKTLIWTAGVEGVPVNGINPEVVAKNKRILVDEFSRIQTYTNIFAIGDIALMKSEQYPKGHPQLASVAMQQGGHLGKNLKQILNGREPEKFEFIDRGTMATIGRNKAVADLSLLKIQGSLAWYLWLVVHLLSLIGFRNKLIVILSWLWNYISYNSSNKLIIPMNNDEERRSLQDFESSGAEHEMERHF